MKNKVELTDNQLYLLSALLRGHLKDLGHFINAEREIAFTRRLLTTLAKAKK